MVSLRKSFLLLLSVVLLAACEAEAGGSAEEGQSDQEASSAGGAARGADSVSGQTGTDVTSALAGTTDLGPPNTTSTGPSSTDAHRSQRTDEDAGGSEPDPGTFGAPCQEPTDCYSGYCVPGPDGPQCTKTCDAACPDGWECRSVASSDGDPTFICVSRTVYLCQPCVEHEDCDPASEGIANLCISWGDDGSFCGISCGENAGLCPDGYHCETIEGASSINAEQCLPDDDVCSCNGAGNALLLSTTCVLTNNLGSCPATRACGPEGLSACEGEAATEETCDGHDDDCDGLTDEDLPATPCEIETEHGNCPGNYVCVDGDLSCEGLVASPETCNGLDDDCDGEMDEAGAAGCTTWYLDADADGAGSETKLCLCQADPDTGYTANNANDCNDNDPQAKPDGIELCNGKDDNCNGLTDEENAQDCSEFFYDGDSDGYGTDQSRCLCVADLVGKWTAPQGGDCQDDEILVNPGAKELCNGKDDDCDTSIDPADTLGCVTYFFDGDGDGWGLDDDTECLCEPTGLYTAFSGPDCDDEVATINPATPDTCNGVNDDCDDAIDEGHPDLDGDSVADCVDEDDDGDLDPDSSDCMPFDKAIHHGADEVCDGVDNDCTDGVDEAGSDGCVDYYLDDDGDGWGLDKSGSCLCGPEGKQNALKDGDCDDGNTQRNPGLDEVCDGIDNNCDLAIDPVNATEGCTDYFLDEDGDSYGDPTHTQCQCGPDTETHYTATNGEDCYDGNAGAKPGQAQYFAVDRGDGSFEYDCIPGIDTQYKGSGTCVGLFFDCDGNSGWWNGTPGCGVAGSWLTSCGFDLDIDCLLLDLGCCAKSESRIQGCH
jgi:hypothetical protein